MAGALIFLNTLKRARNAGTKENPPLPAGFTRGSEI
jgi:hypothetical protein